MTPQKENIKILFQGGRTLTPMYEREYEGWGNERYSNRGKFF